MEFQETYQLKTDIGRFNFSNCIYELEKEKKAGYSEHCHSCYEIEYNIDGESVQVQGERTVTVPVGAIFFAAPLEIHATFKDNRNRSGIFQFSNQLIHNILVNATEHTMFEATGTLKEKGYYVLPEGSRSKEAMTYLLSSVKCWRLDAHPTPEEATKVAENMGREFRELSGLVFLLSALIDEGQLKFVELSSDSAELEGFSPLINSILDAPGYQLDMREAAAMCHMNYSYFSRKFKKVFGRSYTDYINILRIDKAKRLLRDRSLSLKEIAEQLEFGSEYYFNRVFKEYAGIAPSRFRKMQREEI